MQQASRRDCLILRERHGKNLTTVGSEVLRQTDVQASGGGLSPTVGRHPWSLVYRRSGYKEEQEPRVEMLVCTGFFLRKWAMLQQAAHPSPPKLYHDEEVAKDAMDSFVGVLITWGVSIWGCASQT
mmetsp:Transcript_82992/g.138698  ORF Transcript_82992/g.138698 Transcript_82992/m.138698 type:complete len:126 (-) Transcript_82992:138-515(-)